MTTYPSAPVDSDTADTLALIDLDPTAKKDVYRDLWRAFGRSVKEMSVGDLDRAASYLEDALESGDRL